MTFEIVQDLRKMRFWRHFTISSFATGGLISGVLQLSNLLFPTATFAQGTFALAMIVAISAAAGAVLSWPRPIQEIYNSPNTRIRIIKGDLLEQDQHIVVGTCNTFDTCTPVIIAKDSLQGQVLDRLFGSDLEELDRSLSDSLSRHPVSSVVKKPGKCNKYEIGTVATVKQSGRCLFFLAYSELDEQNKATSTVDDVWKSLLALWAAVSIHGNGSAVSIPVIGGGQARLSSVLPAQDSIRFIALSFMIASRRERVCSELRIMVQPDVYERLDRLELQSFLSSLRPS